MRGRVCKMEKETEREGALGCNTCDASVREKAERESGKRELCVCVCVCVCA